ncbi:ERCC4-related helicase [Acholeplasma morum]|uniref:hypothetical protein n=1 Tax=Paracholeplasma morum TaxID=264637 RepID=UPI00195CA567|nr:hypothetical protein [Paracholeplasma morum]MBM7453995.1 ERCC4-related helicase [Paracholeplasma morum]
MKLDLKPLCQRIADRLGIDPLVIKFEEMIDDSKLYIKEEYVAINKKFENDYEECAKSIAHEYRHVFQIFYVSLFSNERSKRWQKELQDVVNSSNMDTCGSNYIAQEIELDAFAFTKYYLEEFENIKVVNRIDKLDLYIHEYIKRSKDIL